MASVQIQYESWDRRRTHTEYCKYSQKNQHSCNFVSFHVEYVHPENPGVVSESATFPASRTILSFHSPVFYRMFYGGFPQETTVKISDVEPSAFKQLLNFIYTGKATVTPDNVLAVIYAAKKYMLTGLVNLCMQHLYSFLDADTVLQLLDQSLLLDEAEFRHRMFEIIKEEASTVLASEDFLTLSPDSLAEILQLDLNIRCEMDVVKAVIFWAENQCRKVDKEPTVSDIRKVLSDNANKLCFKMINSEQSHSFLIHRYVLLAREALHMTTF